MPYIPASAIHIVVSPLVQIMGLSCIVYGINIIDKKVYRVQILSSITQAQIVKLRVEAVKAPLDGFALVE